MNFSDWFNEEEHDLYNFPEESMKLAWDEAQKQKDKEIAELNDLSEKRRQSLVDILNINNKVEKELNWLKGNSIPIEKIQELIDASDTWIGNEDDNFLAIDAEDLSALINQGL